MFQSRAVPRLAAVATVLTMAIAAPALGQSKPPRPTGTPGGAAPAQQQPPQQAPTTTPAPAPAPAQPQTEIPPAQAVQETAPKQKSATKKPCAKRKRGTRAHRKCMKRHKRRAAAKRSVSARASYMGMTTGLSQCFDYQGGINMYTTAPAVVGNESDWVESWNTVAFYNGAGWQVDSSNWVGPFWTHTDYPEWFYYNGQWTHADNGGGASIHNLGIGNYGVGVQYIRRHATGETVYAYTPTTQDYYGTPISDGYCFS